jgi:hypothetical protein
MDPYIKAYVQAHVHVDSGQRVWCKGVELPAHTVGGERKVVLPISKITFTFDDLKRMGAKVDVVTLKSLARTGASARWAENIEERRAAGLPSNVYIANARSIQYAIDRGKSPPPVRYIGRERNQMTEVYDTVDEVVDAMDKGLWRKEFSRGGRAKRRV